MQAQLKDRLIYGALYTGFFFFAFAISAYFTFPYDRLRDFLISKAAGSAAEADALGLKVGGLEPSWITGVTLSDVDVTRPAEPGGEPATLHFDEVTVRAKLLPLLIGNVRVALSAEVGDGTLDATYADGDIREVEAELEELDVQQLGLGSWIGVPLKGRASGTAALAFGDKTANAAGNIALTIDGLQLGDGKAKLKVPGMSDGMTLDQINAGTLVLALDIAEGVAALDKLTTSGPDLKVDGTGGLRLTNPLRRSRIDLQLGLRFSDAYKQKSGKTKALFEIMAMQSDWKRATDADGTMHLHVSGSVQALRATPGSASTAGRGSSSARRRARAGAAQGVLGVTPPAGEAEPPPTDEP